MDTQKIIIIAEAGVNHNGSLELAKKLIDAAEEAGADYVKFQTFKTEKNISKNAPKASYQVTNTGNDESQFEMVKKLELSENEHHELIRYVRDKKVRFLSTPFDFESIDLLKQLGITLGKIPSGEMVNVPYLKKMAASFPNLIMSTGMASMEEIKDALQILEAAGAHRENITVLHCNTEYPTPMKDVNLLAMQSIGREFAVSIGYSDHTIGIEIPIAAAALGATIIEKHFTLDKNMAGPDHVASLDPAELKQMVQSIRNIEAALGNGIKAPSASELKNIQIVRKSIYTIDTIAAGDILGFENLVTKRPGGGLSPAMFDQIIGKKAKRDLPGDYPITENDFE